MFIFIIEESTDNGVSWNPIERHEDDVRALNEFDGLRDAVHAGLLDEAIYRVVDGNGHIIRQSNSRHLV